MNRPEVETERQTALRGLAGALRARLRFHAQCGIADYPFIAPPQRKEAPRPEAKPAAPPRVEPRRMRPPELRREPQPREAPRSEPEVAPLPATPEKLAEVQTVMRACAECSLGSASARMLGRGKAGALLAVVGDWPAPGATADHCFGPEEDEMLWIMMGHEKTLALGPDEVYVTNLLKCAPPPERQPDAAVAAHCLPHLLAEIDAVRPRLVCVMGELTARTLLGGRAAVTRARGRTHALHTPEGRYPLMVTYHPRFLLRTPDMKKAVWEDLLKMRELLAGRTR